MDTPMDCRTAHDLMAGFLDGELSPGHQELLTEHLQHCAACSVLHDALAGQNLSARPIQPMGAEFWAGMDEVLLAEMDATASATPTVPPLQRHRHRRYPSPARLLYVAALLGALGWGLYAQHRLHLSQAETAMLQDALDRFFWQF